MAVEREVGVELRPDAVAGPSDIGSEARVVATTIGVPLQRVAVDADDFWRHYCRDAYGGIIMSVVASQIVGANDRSEAMFAAMATRHTRHALDVSAEGLI